MDTANVVSEQTAERMIATVATLGAKVELILANQKEHSNRIDAHREMVATMQTSLADVQRQVKATLGNGVDGSLTVDVRKATDAVESLREDFNAHCVEELKRFSDVGEFIATHQAKDAQQKESSALVSERVSRVVKVVAWLLTTAVAVYAVMK